MGFLDIFRNIRQTITPKKLPIKRPSKKESRTAIIYKGIGGVKWPNQDYQNYAQETYMKNLIAYRAITVVANAFSSVKWKLMKEKLDGDKEEVFTSPYNNLLKRPNVDTSYNFFTYKIMCWYLITGNAYLEKVGPTSGFNDGIPKELYVLESDKMTISTNADSGRIDAYVYNSGGKKVIFERDLLTGNCDILHLKSFHPLDRYYGFSVTQAAARELDTNNQAVEWNMRLIQNECRPGMLLMFKGMLTDDQYDKLEKKLAEDYAGGISAGQSLILESEEGVIDAKPYSWNPKEMDWIEGNRETARKIAYAYGVPPMLLGIPGDNTYSNYQEARLALWEDTIIPYLNWYQNEKNNWFFGLQKNQFVGFGFEYCLDDVSALIPRREMLYSRAQQSDFLTINEKRKMCGFDDVEGGDVILISATMLPLGQAREEMPPPDDAFPDDEESPPDDEGDETDE